MIKNITLLGFICLFGFGITAQTNFEYKKTKNNVKVYVGPKKGSKYKQCKAIVNIKSSVDEFCKYITNPSNYKSHSDRIESLKVLKKGTNNAYYYLAVDIPWPIANRDGAYYVHQVSKTSTNAKVEIKCKPTYVKEKDGFTRVKVSHTIYNIKKTDNGIELTMFMHAEPGGNVPGWLANYFLIDSPIEICAAIKKDLEAKKF